MENKIYLKRDIYKEFILWKNERNRQTLEISGARQVGKTYLVNKFADEEYTQKIYVNLLEFSGELFLSIYKKLLGEMKSGEQRVQNPVHELIKRYFPDFLDSPETVVIIDEIQESAEIYNRIREFTRNMECDFIITGSYLGRILDKNFKYSAGDIHSLEVNTLSFSEFLKATGNYSLYQELDLYGNSEERTYYELTKLYQIYCKIGGYPNVVLKYLETESFDECQTELINIIQLFTNESKRYFDDILDAAVYDNIFCSVARVLAKEKKGLEQSSYSEELQKLVVQDYSSNISKVTINRAIDWLYSSGIIGFAGKVIECNILNFKSKSRCYFMDVGVATYFLTKIGMKKEERKGIISENFIYINLKKRLNKLGEIALETPAFATYGVHELDFFVRAILNEKTYVIEVKSGKSSNKIMRTLLDKQKVDHVLYAKGNTKGGIDGDMYTIPIYGIEKFVF
jgi:Predicted ATPase (AAA+ superfamily)